MKKLLKGSMLSSGIALGIMASNGASAQGACSVDFKTNSWGSSGQSAVTVTNNGASASGWELCWTYSGDEKITNLWDGTVSQSGKNVCVKNPSYSQNLAAGGSVTFGFLVNSPGDAPTSFTFNGASCGGSGVTPPASSVANITPSSSSAPSSAPVSNNAPSWVLDATGSSLTFVTVKKSAVGAETPEHMSFTQMRGTVSASGQAVLTVPLDSITDGGNITREGRMKSGLFETSHLPNLHFSTQLNLADINTIPVGDTTVKAVTGTLILHGISRSITFDAVITKNTDRIVTVSPRKPIIIDSAHYDMSGGVAWLQAQAGLAAIGERVPVYFKIMLSKDNPNNVAPLSLAAAPSTPLGLTGTSVSTGVSLNWTDASNNETGFLVRRKGPDGYWKTASNSPANTQSYLDALTASGSYEYKIISYRESIPSAPTTALAVAFTSGNGNGSGNSSSQASAGNGNGNSSSSAGGNNGGTFPGNEATGDTLFNTAGCTACHKDNDGDGRFTDGGVPFDVNDWQHPTRPNFVGGNYTGNSVQELARFINERMLGAFAECSAANCGEHIAAYLWALRGRDQDDGVSCDNSSPVNYGIRSVKLLTSFEYHNSLQALFTRPLAKNYGTKELANPDRLVASLPNHTKEAVTESRILSYKQNAEEIAAWAITNNAHGLSCSNTTSNDCANSFTDNFAYLAFRRPLTAEEKTEYSAIVRSGPNGLRWAIQTVLMSPQFLYRTELGIPVSQARSQSWGNNATVRAADGSAYVLDPYEYAAALAYMYTGSSPDRTLLTAAQNGSLENANSLSQQIDRLLDSDLGKAQIGRFAGMWFRTDDVVNMTRNSTALTQAVKDSMAQEIREIYKYAFYNNLPFTDIYTGEYTVLNSTLSQYYGLSGGGTSATDWRVVNTANSKRGGVLASGAFMTVNAHAGRTGPIKRAVHVRQDVLCQNIPLPTSFVDNTGLRDKAAADAQVALEAGSLTTTRFYDMQTAVEGTPCYQCHNAIINPLFAVDDFDHLGNPRRVVNGKVVQKAMDLNGDEARNNDVEVDMVNLGGRLFGANGVGTVGFDEVNAEKNTGRPGLPFTGSKDLGRVMVANELPGVNACLIQKSFRFATGFALSREFQDDTLETPLTPAQQGQFACVVDTLESRLEAANGNPRAMLKELGMSNVVRFRR